MTTIGSQTRETLEQARMTFVGSIDDQEIILQNEDGNYELWAKNNMFAGFVIEVNGIGYEFVRTAIIGDCWWAGLPI